MNDATLVGTPACDDVLSTSAWLRRGLRIALRVALISALIGLALSGFDPRSSSFLENVVYAECIGLLIFVMIACLRRWFPPDPARFTPYLVHGVIAVPVGLFVGLNLASSIFGHPTGLGVFTQAAFFAIPVTIVASAGSMYFLWSRKRLADVAAERAQTERLVAEAKLRMLQAQIEPHMLFNTLANLRTLVDVEPQRAQTMIDQLIVYLRGTLAASRSTTTTLAAEFAQLRAYLELMKVRMATRLDFVLELPETLSDETVPPMMLQPLVENAIRHGLEPQIAGGTVRVIASATAGALTVDVIDDGVGLVASDEADDRTRGYGVAHVRERLRALHGDAARLTLDPGPTGGVRARVVMPR